MAETSRFRLRLGQWFEERLRQRIASIVEHGTFRQACGREARRPDPPVGLALLDRD
jgi:hypothetical protein